MTLRLTLIVSKMTRRIEAAALAGANCSKSAISLAAEEVAMSALSASFPVTRRTGIYRVRGGIVVQDKLEEQSESSVANRVAGKGPSRRLVDIRG